ncbi:MAG: hypothetical protein NTV63_01425 [Candidatus Woesearchaeota archaeon]|nr:hypothetical protein [Candidatus Woesearchaeota archaeon]
MVKILLDTNFLMIPIQFRVDIFTELQRLLNCKYELFTLDLNVEELKFAAKNGSMADKKAAKVALLLIEKKGVSILKTKRFLNRAENPHDVDSCIVEYAKEGYSVATQDKGLRDRIKACFPFASQPIIVLRKKKYLIKI